MGPIPFLTPLRKGEPPKQNPPGWAAFDTSVLYVGVELLSPLRSTIASEELDFRVRNGNGYTPFDTTPTYSTQAVPCDSSLIEYGNEMPS